MIHVWNALVTLRLCLEDLVENLTINLAPLKQSVSWYLRMDFFILYLIDGDETLGSHPPAGAPHLSL